MKNEAHLRCMKNEVWLRHMKFDGIMSKPACALLHTSVSEYFMAAKLPFHVCIADASYYLRCIYDLTLHIICTIIVVQEVQIWIRI